MTHFEQDFTPQSQRDFVMVVTVEGRIKTLRIRDLLDVSPGIRPATTTVVLTGESQEMEGTFLTFQEPCHQFRARCQSLLQAISSGDCQGIDQHFAPRLTRSVGVP